MFSKKINTIIGIAFAVSFFIMGCATLNKINRDLVGPGHTLKKKIVILPFKDLTGSNDNMLGTAAKILFRDTLNEHCKAIIVENDERDRHLEDMAKLDSGATDPVKQNRVARALGLNAILTGTLLDITIAETKEDVSVIEDTLPAAFLDLEVNLYDVETNAVLLSEFVKATVNISDLDRTIPSDQQGYDSRIAKKMLQAAAFQLIDKICTVMEEEPWKGYVISCENSVEISAGSDVGLRKGDVLEVLGCERPIEGNTGKCYLISGAKVGEIKIEKLFQHTAVAEVISGAALDKSNCVKLKSE
ncbi:MAG: hypothetical protein ABIF87_13820 [Pseudomonadota bacterium]